MREHITATAILLCRPFSDSSGGGSTDQTRRLRCALVSFKISSSVSSSLLLLLLLLLAAPLSDSNISAKIASLSLIIYTLIARGQTQFIRVN